MASHHRRRSSLEKASIESILNAADSTQPAAPPSPHIGNSPNRAQFAMPPPPRAVNHTRALSYNPRRPNRLSLSFPIAPNSNESSSRPTPTSSNMPSFPDTPADVSSTAIPSDTNSFLVALAGQERRVLELKEELAKAERELKKLKSEWASHESHKKKAEIRHVEPLRPLSSVGTAEEPARHSAEHDRRRAALLSNLNTSKDNRRKFSGAHTRTLSLLSPERSNFREPRPFPVVEESGLEDGGLSRTATLPTMRAIPDTNQGMSRISQATNRARHSYHAGGVTHGAKQIAEDMKAGIWTFLEDLRQATVGDEAVNGTTNRSSLEQSMHTPPRKTSRVNTANGEKTKPNPAPRSTSPRTWETLTGNSSLVDAVGALWPEMDTPLEPSSAKIPKKSKKILLAAPSVDDLDDDWSNWDSPTPKSPRWSGSTTLSDPATPSNGNADENVAIKTGDEPSTPSKRDSIQWPALDKLTAANLRGGLQRTMSTIMTEWEKGITPPPEENDPSSSQANGNVNTNIQDQILMSQ